MSRILPFLLILSFLGCSSATKTQSITVKTGAEVMISNYLDDLEGRSIGLVMNPTARVHGTHVLDTLMALNANIVALFAPEHGFRGNFGAGERISDGIDEETGLPVFSLYGATRMPTKEMLEGVDLLIFDMQDVGARFYTYLSTMGLVMEAAADHEIEMWILDRPNPAGGDYVSGWMLDPKHTSFVGAYPIPIAHGMTLGELAEMIIGEGWLNAEKPLNYRVIKSENWSRSMLWPATGLEWVPPSPNLPTFEHAFVYLGTCLFEGTNLSEGRGTDDPFLLFGAPDMTFPLNERDRLSAQYNLYISDTTFVPVEIPGRALRPKHQNETNLALSIRVPYMQYQQIDPVAFGHDVLRVALQNTTSGQTNNFLYRLAGTDRIMEYLSSDENAAELWKDEVETFRQARAPYLLYD